MIWMLLSQTNSFMEKEIVSSLVKSFVNVNYILVYTFFFLICNEASIFVSWSNINSVINLFVFFYYILIYLGCSRAMVLQVIKNTCNRLSWQY